MIKQHGKVLACIDGSTLTESVCDHAAWVSKKTGATLELLHTINHHNETAVMSDLSGSLGVMEQGDLMEKITQLGQEQGKLKIQQGKLLLRAAGRHVEKRGIADYLSVQRHGDLIDALIDLESDTRVFVMGLRGRVHEKRENRIGSKPEAIIRASKRPVLIVNDAFQTPKNIMLAYDGGKAANRAVEMIASSPLYDGLTCHVVCVNATDETLSKRAADKIKTATNIDVVAVALKGKTGSALCNYEQRNGIDLTVMGAFSHTRLHDMLMGSTTHDMLIGTKKPVLLLR